MEPTTTKCDDDDDKSNNKSDGGNKKKDNEEDEESGRFNKKRRIVVVRTMMMKKKKKLQKIIKKGAAAAAVTTTTRKKVRRGGLPSFQNRQQQQIITTTSKSSSSAFASSAVATNNNEDDGNNNNVDYDDDGNEFDKNYGDDDDDDDGIIMEIPSDCYLAIQNLHSSSEGLFVPLHGGKTIQVVLESQIYNRFFNNNNNNNTSNNNANNSNNHFSMTIINQELIELKQQNKIRLLYCPPSCQKNNNVWMLTQDYITCVWDSLNYYLKSKQQEQLRQEQQQQKKKQSTTTSTTNEEIISWFVTNLHCWTESTISEYSMKEVWNDDNNKNNKNRSKIQFDIVIKRLLELQVLLRDTTTTNFNSTRYHLWLPKWGIVLKTWNEARMQLMSYLNLKRGEISESNVLSKNRHSSISTKFIVDELLFQGKIRIVQRPFGRFIQKN